MKLKVICGVSWINLEQLKETQAKAKTLGYTSFSEFLRVSAEKNTTKKNGN